MPSTEIIILAQGTQERLGHHLGPKQLLALPRCGNIPIMCRTTRQAWQRSDWWPTIVTWPHVRAGLSWSAPDGERKTITPAYVSLPEPGNSSLKGIARYLEQRTQSGRHYDHTIVLLGDVVYSWACLDAIWRQSKTCGFVGTSDLSSGSGELWGVAWSREHELSMIADLQDAMLRHPPFEDTYQPGQLRRWITGWRRGDIVDHVAKATIAMRYAAVDDYTHDIDRPSDLFLLPALSVSAAADDARHGVSWEGVTWDGLATADLPSTRPQEDL